jgi:hypothetical protein
MDFRLARPTHATELLPVAAVSSTTVALRAPAIQAFRALPRTIKLEIGCTGGGTTEPYREDEPAR